jgi:hypothetical protein
MAVFLERISGGAARRARVRGHWRVVGALGALCALGCSGEIGDGVSPAGPAPAGGQGSGGRSDGAGARPGAGNAAVGGSSAAGAPPIAAPPPASGTTALTRVARLTHEQYQNSIAELFGISDGPADVFAPDALNGFAFDTSVDYVVDARLGPQYRAAAEVVAERAVMDDAVYQRLVGCDSAQPACVSEFIDGFGQRAFRRPLSAEERARFAELFAAGEELVGSGDAFRDGVRVVVEAALQSPQFLYRTELSAAAESDGRIALDDFEVASRLSFMIWNSMPDAALFGDAQSGALSSAVEVETVARRLLMDARATRKLIAFHEQAWQFGRFSKIAPDAATYPDVPADIVARVAEASRRFVQQVIDDGGGLAELLSAPYAFADSELAALYGKSVSGGLARVDFANDERRGFLMQVGFLASNAYAIKTDPIHRGLFVLRDLLCRHIPEPPPGASMTPPPATAVAPKTTREEVSLLTEQSDCSSCHSQINPPGFAFEGFDAIGRARSEEDGTPVDTSGTIVLDGAQVGFRDAGELVDALASSPEARACYTRKWLAFAYGHELDENDEPAVTAIAANALAVSELVARIAGSDALRRRWPNEVAR